ncbi:hypothetical protein [Gilvimarinus polysaccharolyticus]|uniref:hypothetical protein n=1 Tax=Gilvimarinus polysaccharolyticus TaxID=863921 RepID=UPI000673494D|nr:hypothetical protein [Gilvimarinus polysaccharolyticus]
MPEAFGTLVIKAPERILQGLSKSDDGVGWDAMTELFKFSGIDSIKNSHDMLEYAYEGEDFSHEGIELRAGLLEVVIFGDEWMYIAQALIKKGKNIDIYGRISHEHGVTEFYAFNDEGVSYLESIDYEGDVNVDREDEIVAEWLSKVPNNVKKVFPEAFIDSDSE